MKKLNPIKLLVLTLACSLITFSLKAQSSKDVPVRNFNEVSVSSGIDLYLTQSSAENIKVMAHPDLLKDVIIEKENNLLKIRYRNNISWSRMFKGQSIKVYVSYKTLQAVSASGGSDVFTQNTLKTDKLIASASGGSDIELDIITKDLQVQTSGGSDIKLKGSGVNMQASASGGSDIHALEFIVEYAKVTASGGSDANVNVSKALEASASGGSDVNYKGNASVKKTSSSRSGDVKRIN